MCNTVECHLKPENKGVDSQETITKNGIFLLKAIIFGNIELGHKYSICASILPSKY